MKACVFVDGENLRHSIVKLFPYPLFKQENYLPRTNWSELFDQFINEAGFTDFQRVRTYWYVIKMLDCFPYNLPNPSLVSTSSNEAMTKLRAILSQYKPYEDELVTLTPDAYITKMMAMLTTLCERQKVIERRFDGWINIQDGISSNQKGIEFRRAGAIKCDLFENKLGNEKAVDVKLASDMIMLKDIYDIAIIVSGDQDYVPAVEIVKDFGKQVINVAFLTRSGELLPGGARRLNQITDWHCNINYDTFKNLLKL
jgi:uncharacterized LabA/DUF88 family protein